MDIFPKALVEFYAGLWEPVADQDLLHLVTMVALEDDCVVLRGSTAGAVGLQFGCQIGQIHAFSVNAFDDGSWFPPLAHLHTHLHSLLLHADRAADTEILGKAAGRTDVGHSRSSGLLCDRPRTEYHSLRI
jgi:hypothetical protein